VKAHELDCDELLAKFSEYTDSTRRLWKCLDESKAEGVDEEVGGLLGGALTEVFKSSSLSRSQQQTPYPSAMLRVPPPTTSFSAPFSSGVGTAPPASGAGSGTAPLGAGTAPPGTSVGATTAAASAFSPIRPEAAVALKAGDDDPPPGSRFRGLVCRF